MMNWFDWIPASAGMTKCVRNDEVRRDDEVRRNDEGK